MSETTGMAIDWKRLRMTRWSYRLLFLLVIAVFAASQIVGVSESGAGRVSLPDALVMAMGFVYAAFLYFFLETARLMGYPGPRILAIALFALLPLVNIPTIVIVEVGIGMTLVRWERGAIAPTDTAAGLRGTSDAATGPLGLPTRKPLLQRLLISLFVGLAVFAICCYSAFNTFRDVHYIQWDGRYTLTYIANVQKAIETYRQEHQALPDSLCDLSPLEDARFRTDESGTPVDWWNLPLQYSTDGTDYYLVSYGRDGKPGGMGFDADLSTADLPEGEVDEHELPPLPPQAKATFRQFVGDLGAFGRAGSGREMFVASIWAGVVGFVLGFVLSGTAQRARRRVLDSLLQVVITVGATAFIAVLITTLHVPTGH